MIEPELRAKIRELMALGVLPSGAPLIERPRLFCVVKYGTSKRLGIVGHSEALKSFV